MEAFYLRSVFFIAFLGSSCFAQYSAHIPIKPDNTDNSSNKKLTAVLIEPGQEILQDKAAYENKGGQNNISGRNEHGNQVTALTLRTWTGATNNTFNTSTNWNPNGVPSSTDSCVIILSSTKTISLNANSIVGALYVSISGNAVVVRLDAAANSLTINGTTTLRASGGNLNTQLQVNVGNGGSVIYGGALSCTGFSGNQGVIFPVLGAGGTTGTVTFKGDVTYKNAVASSTANLPASVIFDSPTSQTINNVSSNYLNPISATVLFGSANTPTVTITGLQSTWFTTGNATVKAGACLILPGGNGTTTGGTFCQGSSFPNPAAGGVFTLGAGATVKAGDLQSDYGAPPGFYGGVAGSNFPGNFSTYSLNSTSVSEYNSLTAVNQTVYNTPVYGNLTLTNGSGSGATTKTAGGNLTVNGNLTINALATFDGSTFSHIVGGNWANNGTFTAGTSTVSFSGTAAQTISGSSTTTFNNLTINNSNASGVTLSAPANASSALVMTAGLLNTTSTNILTLQNGCTATAATATSTSYVNGPLKYQKSVAGSTALNFPIGKSPDCRPVTLTVNHTDGTLYNYTAESFNANPWTTFGSTASDMPSTVDTISGVHYVKIDRTDGAAVSQPTAGLSGNQTIQMFFGTNDGVYQGSTLTIVKNTAATPATWIDIGGSSSLGNFSSAQTGSVSSTSSPTAFNSFSSFALGSKTTGWNPLPIELLDFSAIAHGNKVDVKWSTASETNNKFFTVEKSSDGKTFTKVIDVSAAGNSVSTKNYFEIDPEPYPGTSYYRLKQTDYNGNFKYFNMVPVCFDVTKGVWFFPNPVSQNEKLNVSVSGFKDKEVLLVLRDMQGKEYVTKLLVSEQDNQLFAIDELQTLPPGNYLIVATSNNSIYSHKLIIR